MNIRYATATIYYISLESRSAPNFKVELLPDKNPSKLGSGNETGSIILGDWRGAAPNNAPSLSMPSLDCHHLSWIALLRLHKFEWLNLKKIRNQRVQINAGCISNPGEVNRYSIIYGHFKLFKFYVN